MVIEDAGKPTPENAIALREQQKVDLERGLEYAKKVLDTGVRWRNAG
jgi:hypothetical protein